MATIKKISVGGTTYDLNDTRITGVDSTPTASSGNVVTSGGVSTALGNYLPLAGGKMTGAAPQSFTPNKIAWDFRPDQTNYYCRAQYMTYGSEAMVFANKSAGTSFILKCGYELTNGSGWNSVFNNSTNIPTLQAKNQSLYINGFLDSGVSPSYNLYVGGTAATSGDMTVGGDVRVSGNDLYVGSASNSQCHQQYDATNKCLKFIFD